MALRSKRDSRPTRLTVSGLCLCIHIRARSVTSLLTSLGPNNLAHVLHAEIERFAGDVATIKDPRA